MDTLSGHAPSGAPTVTVPPLEDTTVAEHATSTDTGSEYATKRYGDDADQQIFALGDAALQLDDVNSVHRRMAVDGKGTSAEPVLDDASSDRSLQRLMHASLMDTLARFPSDVL